MAKQKGVQESLDFIIEHMITRDDVRDIVREEVKGVEERLTAKIDRVENKLGAFENNEVDKRKLLEVRVTKLETSVHG